MAGARYLGGLVEFQTKVVWKNVLGFLVLHVVAAQGLYQTVHDLLRREKLWFFVFNFAAAVVLGQSVTAGAHRLFSHRSYKAKLPLRLFFLLVHTATGQNCMYVWVRDHRQHHKYTDTNADPHNAKRGFFFSHCGWLMMRKHEDVLAKGRTVDMSDLDRDPFVMFQKRHYYKLYACLQLALLFLPCRLFGTTIVEAFLAQIARYVFTLHCTWSVNSFAHLYGTKPFDRSIMPSENRAVSFFTNGEGWHNYHHVFPWDYRASEYGATDNFTTTVIDFLAGCGLVRDRRTASRDMVQRRMTRTGDPSRKPNADENATGMSAAGNNLAYVNTM